MPGEKSDSKDKSPKRQGESSRSKPNASKSQQKISESAMQNSPVVSNALGTQAAQSRRAKRIRQRLVQKKKAKDGEANSPSSDNSSEKEPNRKRPRITRPKNGRPVSDSEEDLELPFDPKTFQPHPNTQDEVVVLTLDSDGETMEEETVRVNPTMPTTLADTVIKQEIKEEPNPTEAPQSPPKDDTVPMNSPATPKISKNARVVLQELDMMSQPNRPETPVSPEAVETATVEGTPQTPPLPPEPPEGDHPDTPPLSSRSSSPEESPEIIPPPPREEARHKLPPVMPRLDIQRKPKLSISSSQDSVSESQAGETTPTLSPTESPRSDTSEPKNDPLSLTENERAILLSSSEENNTTGSDTGAEIIKTTTEVDKNGDLRSANGRPKRLVTLTTKKSFEDQDLKENDLGEKDYSPSSSDNEHSDSSDPDESSSEQDEENDELEQDDAVPHVRRESPPKTTTNSDVSSTHITSPTTSTDTIEKPSIASQTPELPNASETSSEHVSTQGANAAVPPNASETTESGKDRKLSNEKTTKKANKPAEKVKSVPAEKLKPIERVPKMNKERPRTPSGRLSTARPPITVKFPTYKTKRHLGESVSTIIIREFVVGSDEEPRPTVQRLFEYANSGKVTLDKAKKYLETASKTSYLYKKEYKDAWVLARRMTESAWSNGRGHFELTGLPMTCLQALDWNSKRYKEHAQRLLAVPEKIALVTEHLMTITLLTMWRVEVAPKGKVIHSICRTVHQAAKELQKIMNEIFKAEKETRESESAKLTRDRTVEWNRTLDSYEYDSPFVSKKLWKLITKEKGFPEPTLMAILHMEDGTYKGLYQGTRSHFGPTKDPHDYKNVIVKKEPTEDNEEQRSLENPGPSTSSTQDDVEVQMEALHTTPTKKNSPTLTLPMHIKRTTSGVANKHYAEGNLCDIVWDYSTPPELPALIGSSDRGEVRYTLMTKEQFEKDKAQGSQAKEGKGKSLKKGKNKAKNRPKK